MILESAIIASVEHKNFIRIGLGCEASDLYFPSWKQSLIELAWIWTSAFVNALSIHCRSFSRRSDLDVFEALSLMAYRIAGIYHESFNFVNFANFKWYTKIKASTWFLFILFQFARLLLHMQPLQFFPMSKSNY